ncbi:MAG: hypothetical protein KGI54_11575 [Pseudomonadota bacterium]|nr:hypothetical protein [Pseudomonadota bacterium]
MCGTLDSLTDAWHGISAPVVDSQLGRFATNVATGGMAAPAFAAYDISRGKDIGSSVLGGVAGYYGGQALGGEGGLFGGGATGEMPGFGEAGAGTEISAPAASATPSLGTMGGAAGAAQPALATQGLGDLGSSSGWSNFDNAPLGSGVSGAGGANLATQSVADMSPAATVGQGGAITGFNQSNPNFGTLGAPSQDTASMWDKITGSMPSANTALMGGRLLAGMHDMQARQNVGDALKSRYNSLNAGINNMYAPGSPEALAMEQQLARKDAASGRNSQYGKRAVDLQAAIAAIKAHQTAALNTGQNDLLGNATAYQNSTLNGLFNAGGNTGAYQSLKDLLGKQNGI